MFKNYGERLKTEFKGYNGKSLSKDMLAGITVAAVALPLALAFGVSSGATAASGLITAIVAGVIIGLLSGGSYQISGPTGAMTAILLSLVAKYQLQGVFIASLMSGIILLICGLLKLGKIVSYLPLPVITGFTSGIAIIIAFGQINNFTGLTCSGDSTISKTVSYFTTEQHFSLTTFIIGAAVVLFMALYPKKINQYFPSSLAAIILATACEFIFDFDVAQVGEIPKTVFLPDRLDLSAVTLEQVEGLIVPAISIAALGLIESLLCGASAGRMKNEKLDANQELIAQGIGNMVIPFFGGVPATAAIARTAVAIKAGGKTRLTSVFHAVVLLLSMFLLAPVISRIPLAALAGVLMMTAWRMNDWAVIRGIFSRKIKTQMAQYLITMAATVVFDLTIAILIGVLFSVVMFVLKVSDMQISVADVDPERMPGNAGNIEAGKTSVVYITGPLYFGTSSQLEDKLSGIEDKETVIFSMRGVPFADASGVQVLQEFVSALAAKDITVLFTAIQPPVKEMFDRCGLTSDVGEERFFWSTDKALDYISIDGFSKCTAAE
ncbi:MAG: SulP family inorganic anion transporter [Oscillospiraceae bacterium]|nr:SulP family inorganic anion transporter [Oscillospiraceae bacterium]